MNLSPKYIAAIVCGTAFILIWNAFLIVRDNNMFKAYEERNAEICRQLPQSNPHCTVK